MVGQSHLEASDGVVASATSLVEIAEVERILECASGEDAPPFSAAELAYARNRSDPARRLAARLAAKRAAVALLGPGTEAADVEVIRTDRPASAFRRKPKPASRPWESAALS
jgi:phosphopantetheinyl transferase (holo-ACP synthase)